MLIQDQSPKPELVRFVSATDYKGAFAANVVNSKQNSIDFIAINGTELDIMETFR